MEEGTFRQGDFRQLILVDENKKTVPNVCLATRTKF